MLFDLEALELDQRAAEVKSGIWIVILAIAFVGLVLCVRYGFASSLSLGQVVALVGASLCLALLVWAVIQCLRVETISQDLEAQIRALTQTIDDD